VIAKDMKKLLRLLPAARRHEGGRYSLLLRPGEDLQAREGLLNTGFTLSVRRHAGHAQEGYQRAYNAIRHEMSPSRFGRFLWKIVRRSSFYVQDRFGPQLEHAQFKMKEYGLYAVMRAEQAPNRDSRVVLSDERDALGVARAALDWRFSSIDKHSARGAMMALDRELRRLDLGYAVPEGWLEDEAVEWECDKLVSAHPIGGYHHMGTARMGISDKESVTDGDGRVHGVENLYIAGSALFPTGGWANPTLTIIALALRLADKIKDNKTGAYRG
jgi:choline dehydrogenase-like flavoprotein